MAEALNDLINASKIPDPIKYLPCYDGDAKTLHHWLTSAENIINLYNDVRVNHPDVFNVWIGVIRTKIIKKANEALIMRNTPTVWANIRTTLIDYFGDRRDLSTLCQNIPYMKQKGKSVDQFYREVTELTANINQKIVLDERYQGHIDAVMIFVNEITKNAFIDGLNEPYNLTVRGFRPLSLEEAKSAAEEQIQSVQRNQSFSHHSQGQYNQNNFNNSRGNSRMNNNQRQNLNQNRNDSNKNYNDKNNFYNRNDGNYRQNFPQTSNFNQNQNAGESFRQNAPRNNFSRQNPTPMEVDPSTRSRQSVPQMSTSQRTRVQLTNAEQEEISYEKENYQEDENVIEETDDVNFHIAGDPQSTG